MTNKKISIIIPYFNNENTIVETLDSVFSQHHKNIEVIVINDGSKKQSLDFLNSLTLKYTITVLSQDNSGPSIARNYGSTIATGEFLLFLDADDLIHETYLQKCLEQFNQNNKLEIVYCEARYFEAINEDWNLPEVKFPQFLLNNCIFISALIKAETFNTIGKFDTNINILEDWDLWLRIMKKYGENCSYRIPEKLFFYRKRNTKNSITDTSELDEKAEKCRLYVYNKNYDFYKKYQLDLTSLFNAANEHLRFKRKYYNVWYRKLFYGISENSKLYITYLKYNSYLKNKKYIFFFPYYHIGGAEKVHLDILKCFKKEDTLTFITSESLNNGFKKEFEAVTNIVQLTNFKKDSVYEDKFKKIFFQLLNQDPKRVYFGCNSAFYYDHLHRIDPRSKKVDLIHAFSYEEPKAAEKISLPCVDVLNERVILGNKTLNDFRELYIKNNIDLNYLERIKIIQNKIDIPKNSAEIIKSQFAPLKILFVGRNSYEKRPELFTKVAQKSFEENLNVEFKMIGDFDLDYCNLPNVSIEGLISQPEIVSKHYQDSHVLLITSSREGLPMVILESMVHGVVPISTNVGEISELINTKNNNGILIENSKDIEQLALLFISKIKEILANRELFESLSKNAYSSVIENYNPEKFTNNYQKLLQYHD